MKAADDVSIADIMEYLHRQRRTKSVRSLAAEIGISKAALEGLYRQHHVPDAGRKPHLRDYFRRHASAEARSVLVQLPRPPLEIVAKWDQVMEEIASGQVPLYALDPRAFEDLMAWLLERFGWQVTSMGYTKDGGADLLAVKQVNPGVPFEMLVQCKRFAPHRKVGISYVREL